MKRTTKNKKKSTKLSVGDKISMTILLAGLVLGLGLLIATAGPMIYRSMRTLKVGDCVKHDSSPKVCESWEPNCRSYSIEKITEIGKHSYRTVYATFTDKGTLIPFYSSKFSDDYLSFSSAKFYEKVQCPTEMLDAGATIQLEQESTNGQN